MSDVSRETSGAPTERELAYVERLRTAGLNLVSARDRDLLTSRHLPEARAFADGLPDVDRVVDVGSGGGLPGMVIAMVRPSTEVVLVESRQRKALWLQDTASALGLERVRVHASRAEELDLPPIDGTTLVTARAVAPLPRLLDHCRRLAAGGATLHAIKGQRWPQELADAQPLDDRGWKLVATPDDDLDGLRTCPHGPHDPHPMVVILRAI